jgi:hypothetical protein
MMIWADRFAIGFLILGFLFFSYMVQTFQGGAILSGIVAVVAWVIFRTVDFMFGRGARRGRRRCNRLGPNPSSPHDRGSLSALYIV